MSTYYLSRYKVVLIILSLIYNHYLNCLLRILFNLNQVSNNFTIHVQHLISDSFWQIKWYTCLITPLILLTAWDLCLWTKWLPQTNQLPYSINPEFSGKYYNWWWCQGFYICLFTWDIPWVIPWSRNIEDLLYIIMCLDLHGENWSYQVINHWNRWDNVGQKYCILERLRYQQNDGSWPQYNPFYQGITCTTCFIYNISSRRSWYEC